MSGSLGLSRIVKTADRGVTWETQATEFDKLFTNVAAVDARTAWAVGAGTILRTIDGEVWEQQIGAPNEWLYGVDAIDADTAWIVGDKGTILKTVDGGTSGPTSLK